MKPSNNHPTLVYQRAHRDYPRAVGFQQLYGAAFFGHGRPAGVVRTPESVWRGLIRMHVAWLAFRASMHPESSGFPKVTWTPVQTFWYARYRRIRAEVMQDTCSVETFAIYGQEPECIAALS